MRFIEKILAAVILLTVLPLVVLVVIALKIESKDPILYSVNRRHLNGNVSKVWKFRTVTFSKAGYKGKCSSGLHYRITIVGSFLRRSGLDEIPTLLSVLSGEISMFEQKAAKYPFYFRVASEVWTSRLLAAVASLIFGLGYLYLSSNPHPAVYTLAFFLFFAHLLDCIVVVYRYKKRIYGSSAQELQELISYLESQRKSGSGGGGGTKQLYPDDQYEMSKSSNSVANGII